MKKGVFIATKKDGTTYYRSSITYNNKHISLGSFDSEDDAHNAYLNAEEIITNNILVLQKFLDYYNENSDIKPMCNALTLDFEKAVSLFNYRDNGLYSANPIYVSGKIIYYYLSCTECYKFDMDDLFFYVEHKIQKRGGHLFYQEFGKQLNLLNRYGIKNNAVLNKDYKFVNNDPFDFRYSNILIINEYQGVNLMDEEAASRYLGKKTRKQYYKTYIHINGNYLVGVYDSKEKAAIAYNKAADILRDKGCNIGFTRNVINRMTNKKYNSLYDQITISEEIINLQF